MKRQNLMIDAALLEEAKALLGTATLSEAVNRSLSAAVRLARLKGFSKSITGVQWEGDLDQLRGRTAAGREKVSRGLKGLIPRSKK